MKLAFGMIKLIVDKTYSIEFENGKKIHFQLIRSLSRYFLDFDYYNDYLFQLFNIDKSLFTEKILGYYNDGGWPFCKTRRDCEKLLYELLKEGSQRGFKFTCDFTCDVSHSFWED